jgi:hypothetical protein
LRRLRPGEYQEPLLSSEIMFHHNKQHGVVAVGTCTTRFHLSQHAVEELTVENDLITEIGRTLG